MAAPVVVAYTLWPTDWGWMGALASETGLRRMTLPQPSREAAAALIEAGASAAFPFPDLPQRMRRYLQGAREAFPYPLDLRTATIFQSAVWQATSAIPYGETRSYAWIARALGRPQAPRAVGQALGANPLPIVIPCHRVLASDGALGGYGGGLALKRRLLALEGAPLHPSVH